MDPLVFILWFAVAAGLLFWGRGAFGWLCPFGALQELTNHLGRRLGVPQLKVPWGLNERLWPLKYVIFLGLFGLSLLAGRGRAAWRSSRSRPRSSWASSAAGRSSPSPPPCWWQPCSSSGSSAATCAPGRRAGDPRPAADVRLAQALAECGSPCQRCANECPVAAIHPNGVINVHECIYCLDCQKLYYDDHKCPHDPAAAEARAPPGAGLRSMLPEAMRRDPGGRTRRPTAARDPRP